jgi:hypothetical protein
MSQFQGYLDRIRGEKSKTSLGKEVSKISKLPPRGNFDTFETSQPGCVSENRPPLDAAGYPFTACPRCGEGAFWRPSRKYHPDTFNPKDWRCSTCEPPQMPCDHCGVPTAKEIEGTATGCTAARKKGGETRPLPQERLFTHRKLEMTEAVKKDPPEDMKQQRASLWGIDEGKLPAHATVDSSDPSRPQEIATAKRRHDRPTAPSEDVIA